MEHPTARIVQPKTSNGWIPVTFGVTAFLVYLFFTSMIYQGQKETAKKDMATKALYEQCKEKTKDIEWCVIAFHPNL